MAAGFQVAQTESCQSSDGLALEVSASYLHRILLVKTSPKASSGRGYCLMGSTCVSSEEMLGAHLWRLATTTL